MSFPIYKKSLLRVVAGFLLVIALLAGCAAGGNSNRSAADRETVVLVHGLGRSAAAMWLLKWRIQRAGYDVVALDYPSLGTGPDAVIADVSAQIDAACQGRSKVHFVGHSLGGLLIRLYFTKAEGQKLSGRLGRVIMMGTPNAGTVIVDHFRDNWLAALMGQTALSLGTTADSLPRRLPPPPFRAGIIAGTSGSWATDSLFKAANDGLVAVASTHLPNMADYVEIDVSHSMMRYNREVADQTVAFLKTGRFSHVENPS